MILILIRLYSNTAFREEFLSALSGLSSSPSKGLFINGCYAHCQTEMQETWFSSDSPVLNNKVSSLSVLCFSIHIYYNILLFFCRQLLKQLAIGFTTEVRFRRLIVLIPVTKHVTTEFFIQTKTPWYRYIHIYSLQQFPFWGEFQVWRKKISIYQNLWNKQVVPMALRCVLGGITILMIVVMFIFLNLIIYIHIYYILYKIGGSAFMLRVHFSITNAIKWCINIGMLK